MAFVIALKGGNDIITILESYYIGFYGSTIPVAIPVGSYQSKTYATDATGETNNGELPNVKYLTDTTCSVAGGGSESLSASNPSNAESTVHTLITNDSAVTIQHLKFYLEDVTSLICKGIRQGDTSWVNIAEYANALEFGDSGPATSHDFYLSLSISPTAAGSITVVKLVVEGEYY